MLLLGPSGAGKSTLLHALAGVLGDSDAGAHHGGTPDAEDSDETGTLLIDGAAPRAQRGRAGLMQQDPETQVVLSRLGDDVAFGAENLSVPRGDIWTRVGEALDDVGLAHLPLDHPTSALSGGQKQRLALAGILAMRPGCCSWTNPPPTSTPPACWRSATPWAGAWTKRGRRWWWWSTAWACGRTSWTGSWCCSRDRPRNPPCSSTGPPDQVLAQARDMLVAAGVWVPGYVPATRARAGCAGAECRGCRALRAAGAGVPAAGNLLLAAENLAVSREAAAAAGGSRPSRRSPCSPASRRRSGPAQALTITGPNGSGKSTFALTLAGLLQPVEGKVSATVDLSDGAGIDPYKWKAEQLIARIGTVFQEPEHQFVTGRVLDELMFGPRHLGHGEERVDELLERLRLTRLVDANPYTLSGGEKRRLSVATVLAAHPRVLILDEPTFGQDANTWAELASFLSELLDAGTAVVSVTHDQEFSDVLGGTELKLGAPELKPAAQEPGPRNPEVAAP